MITVYHQTNLNSANEMLKTGIGLNIDWYNKAFQEIGNYYNIPIESFSKFSKELCKQSETQGGVSFFQNYKQCVTHDFYGKHGGEYRGNIIKGVLKKTARLKKIKLAELPGLNMFLEKYNIIHSPVVVLKVILPLKYIVNKNDVNSVYELYTNKKVPKEYIDTIYSFMPTKEQALILYKRNENIKELDETFVNTFFAI